MNRDLSQLDFSSDRPLALNIEFIGKPEEIVKGNAGLLRFNAWIRNDQIVSADIPLRHAAKILSHLIGKKDDLRSFCLEQWILQMLPLFQTDWTSSGETPARIPTLTNILFLYPNPDHQGTYLPIFLNSSSLTTELEGLLYEIYEASGEKERKFHQWLDMLPGPRQPDLI